MYKPDEYLSVYIHTKLENPNKQILLRQYKASIVEGVDRLVKLGRGRTTISNQSDWDVVDEIIRFFVREWPSEWKEFTDTVPDIRHTRRSGGWSKTKNIMYVASLPWRLERLIQRVFPLHEYNKKFIHSLIKRYKIFKIGGEQN